MNNTQMKSATVKTIWPALKHPSAHHLLSPTQNIDTLNLDRIYRVDNLSLLPEKARLNMK